MNNLFLLPIEILKIIIYYCDNLSETMLNRVNKSLKELTIRYNNSLSFDSAIRNKNYGCVKMLLDLKYYFDVSRYIANIIISKENNLIFNIIDPKKHIDFITHTIYNFEHKYKYRDLHLDFFKAMVHLDLKTFLYLCSCMKSRDVVTIATKYHRLDAIFHYEKNKHLPDWHTVEISKKDDLTNSGFYKNMYNYRSVISYSILTMLIAKGDIEELEWCFKNARDREMKHLVYNLSCYNIYSENKDVVLWMYNKGYYAHEAIIEFSIINGIIDKISDLGYYVMSEGKIIVKYYNAKNTTVKEWKKCETIEQEIAQLKEMGLMTKNLIVHYSSLGYFNISKEMNFFTVSNELDSKFVSSLMYYGIKYNNLFIFNVSCLLKYNILDIQNIISLDNSSEDRSINCLRLFIDFLENKNPMFMRMYFKIILERSLENILNICLSQNRLYGPIVDIYNLRGIEQTINFLDKLTYQIVIHSDIQLLFETNCVELINYFYGKRLNTIYDYLIKYSSLNCITEILKDSNINKTNDDLMKIALKYRDITIVKYLLGRNVKFSSNSLLSAFRNSEYAANWLLSSDMYDIPFTLMEINKTEDYIENNSLLLKDFYSWVVSKKPKPGKFGISKSIKADNLIFFKYLIKEKQITHHQYYDAKKYKAKEIVKYMESKQSFS